MRGDRPPCAPIVPFVRVHVVDPSAYTPPYDHALCSALGAAGAEVTLFTSRFAYGAVPPADGYARRELFYRAALGAPGSRLRAATKLAEHVPDMLRYRRLARATADVVHFQWLSVQHLDGRLLPRPAPGPRPRRAGAARPRSDATSLPLVLTAHDILPREPRPGQLRAQRRLYARFDAIVVHSEHGRARLTDELGVDRARVHVIPHGALLPWGSRGDVSAGADTGAREGALRESRLPPELSGGERRVVLFFGLLRPYKGIDLLLQAWRGIAEDAELWIVGMPRFDIAALRAGAPANVRFVPRFVTDSEAAACFARADLVVLPYREIDQSGVAFSALGAGVPLLLSDVGGFPELAATGVARTFPAGDVAVLHASLRELLSDPDTLSAMSSRAREAADGPYSWDTIARRTLDLYSSLAARSSVPSP
jgi:glycosyltransferase involved in cell wall biosynthesis